MKIEFDEQCSACKGTGLFQGMAERDGFAVVCHKCGGSGKFHFVHEYEPFTERKLRTNIHTVIETNPGIIVRGNKFNFGGLDYRDWLAGLPFPIGSEMRQYVCPSWWYQSADYKKKPDWSKCLRCGSFSSCRYFHQKELCWAKWDRENGVTL